MVGEMRDKETVATAVSAAETGHLVLSTVHTNNAAQTIDRIIDAFPPNQQDQIRTQLAGSLLGIFSQRLVPTISGELVPAYELMVNTSAVSNLIREARTHELNSVIQTSAESGMISMDQVLSKLVHDGVISLENALRYSLDPEALKRML
jgi:twitching motility protein PilT